MFIEGSRYSGGNKLLRIPCASPTGGKRPTPELLFDCGIIKQVENGGVKILGNGEVTKAFTVKANAFSKSAQEKIEAAGGRVEVI